ncbi:class I SAM-dependent methyltransferase [Bosea sp. BH3]|uniref:class I SAM-dependent methyltransferase n=1 Tax=Bosea sp. BH3 TaxID=2871701 RepID=UPI0021CB8CA6|nr:class I SAM-dependent methyltransferase [Bosea sp. BH3]MCU4180501.1 DUF938 domain-containing protein [Bosea sp. BH3]
MSKPSFWQPTQDERSAADPRLRAPSALRNRDAILAVLRDVLPAAGLVLEVASGSGEHAVHFASALPALTFQPSDPTPEAIESIAAWIGESGLPNILPPLLLDAGMPQWPIAAADAVLCINMVHISPWRATAGLFRQAGRLLKPGSPLYLYGPYRRPGQPLEPSNAAFDESLRSRNAEWGLRDLEAVEALAANNGFNAAQVIEMPANNLSLIFRKR